MTELRATLRLQFHADFTFDDALMLLDYFSDLGISHLYASPILTARSGSRHGYDMVDPTRVSTELGGETGLRRLVEGLRQRGMGLIVDMVSNHMGTGEANAWWMDFLKWGKTSPCARFFDIHWCAPEPDMHDKIFLPVLDSDYAEVLASDMLRLDFEPDGGSFCVRYGERHFPLWPGSYDQILLDHPLAELRRLGESFKSLENQSQARVHASLLCCKLAALVRDGAMLQDVLDHFRQDKQRLHRLLEKQHYRLANWRTASDALNWRRFFDINELVGLRVEDPMVFECLHERLFSLIQEGLIDGLRIDHIDGLTDPHEYCRRLRRRCQRLSGRAEFPLYVEKILAPGERLPLNWSTDGTTGYDFMNQVSLLQHDPDGEETLIRLWHLVSGRPKRFADEVHSARQLILRTSLTTDFETVAQCLYRIARIDIASRDVTLASIRRALFQLVSAFPVYRTYANACGRSSQDTAYFAQAREQAKQNLDPNDCLTLNWLDDWLGGESYRRCPVAERPLRREAIGRFQQLTSPVAAKAVEDTACYRSAVLLSRNDVGFDPGQFSADANAFHTVCLQRLKTFPNALLTTATHDHKRGEDCRARLAVVSERAEQFVQWVTQWRAMAKPLRTSEAIPSPGDELIVYQCLLSSWPLELKEDDIGALTDYHDRLQMWLQKSLREAKLDSRWSTPDADYEDGAALFLRTLMLTSEGKCLRTSIAHAARSLMCPGALNGLVQCLLRSTTPGIPDLYQGAEYWDFSLVDPDNRRAPDFQQRRQGLVGAESLSALLDHWRDGRVKQALIARILHFRRRHPDLFRDGDYRPVHSRGRYAAHVLAFTRGVADRQMLVVVPRLAGHLLDENDKPLIPKQHWLDTELVLPDEWKGRSLLSLCDEQRFDLKTDCLPLTEVLGQFPVNLLYITDVNQEHQR